MTKNLIALMRKTYEVGQAAPPPQRAHLARAPPPDPSDSSVFGRWCQMTNFHGVLDFYYAKGLLAKGVWLTVLVVGLFLAANQSTELIMTYALDDRWITTMSSESAPDGRMKWPNILICKSTQTELRLLDLERRGLTDPYDIAYIDAQRDGVAFHDRFQSDTPAFANESQLHEKMEELRKKLNCSKQYPFCLQSRLSCRRTVIDCGAGAGHSSGVVYCDCSKYASKSAKPDCFKVNAPAIIRDKSSRTGSTVGYHSGIYLLLNPRIHETHPYLLKDDYLPPAGLRVEISFDQEVSRGVSSPIFLWPGGLMVIAMTAEKRRISVRKRHSLPFQMTQMPCSPTGQYKWFNTDIASRQLCQNDCFVEFCAQYLNCTIEFQPDSTHVLGRECTTEERRNCSLAKLELRGLLPSGFNVTSCENSCKEPCEADFITTKLTTSMFPAPNKVNALGTYLNRARVSNNSNQTRNLNLTKQQIEQLILLNMFYESDEYRVIEEVNRYSLDELISNIGGVLGVWTGISMITVFQAILYAARGLERLFECAGKYLKHNCWPRPKSDSS